MNDNSRQILDKKNDKTFQLALAPKIKYKIEKVSIITTLPVKTIKVNNITSIELNYINIIQIIISELSFIFLMFLSLSVGALKAESVIFPANCSSPFITMLVNTP